MVEHLERCARCRSRFEASSERRPGLFLEKLAGVLPWPRRAGTDYGRAIAAAEQRLLSHVRALAVERAEAPSRLAELLEQPPKRREMLMRNHPRFQTWGLLERLLEHAQGDGFTDPSSAENLARLALSLADALDSGYYGEERIEDLRARAWGYVGDARRIRFELRSAEEAFERALAHLRRGTRDPLERALLLDLQASLWRDQRRFAAAERLLLRALQIYREVGETHRAGRTLVSLSAVYEQAGTPAKALPMLREALQLIDGELEPRVLLIAHHNLITTLAEDGRFMEAQRLLIQARGRLAHLKRLRYDPRAAVYPSSQSVE
jgi:tetratricopeptide (TPR) repeat protein